MLTACAEGLSDEVDTSRLCRAQCSVVRVDVRSHTYARHKCKPQAKELTEESKTDNRCKGNDRPHARLDKGTDTTACERRIRGRGADKEEEVDEMCGA